MGMAASQARHISLVARKTNVEWEGQQINQARTALANETASLFNQMLGMTVPDCPDTTDFTKVQYSYSDGLNSSTIDSYYQISNPDPEFNYVVTHSYYTDVYTGSMKKLNDPQVQFDKTADVPTLIDDYNTKSEAYVVAKNALAQYADALNTAKVALSNITGNVDGNVTTSDATYDSGTGKYTITPQGQPAITLSPVTVSDKNNLIALIGKGTMGPEFNVDDIDSYIDNSDIYVITGNYYKAADLALLVENSGGTIKKYVPTTDQGEKDLVTAYNTALTNYNSYKNGAYATAEGNFNAASAALGSALSYVGNCPLSVVDLTGEDAEAIRTELNQVVKDLAKDDVKASILDSWDNTEPGGYIPGKEGTIFSFTLNNVTYFTTLDDLMESYMSGTGNNNIDGQKKLSYYTANYQSTKITKTERALLETDGAGRFTSVKFEDDTIKYVLSTETTTDTEAYDNAMNQYYYEVQKYEKTIADINARTEIIQNEDRTLELRLKQLDTEESALSNEIDAVKKVLKDNVEKSFKTFAE